MSFHGCAQDRSFLCGRPFALVRKTLSVCAEKTFGPCAGNRPAFPEVAGMEEQKWCGRRLFLNGFISGGLYFCVSFAEKGCDI